MKKLNLFRAEEDFRKLGLKIFTPKDLMVSFRVGKRAAEAFLYYNVKKGAVVRLKAGLFAFVKNLPGDFTVANRLYFPSYISLETACAFYNLIPEAVYSITSVTTKPTREFLALGKSFAYKRIKKEAYTGYVLTQAMGEKFYLANPEKAVADLLWFVYLRKAKWNERLKITRLDLKKLEEYLRLFSPKLISFAQKIIKNA